MGGLARQGRGRLADWKGRGLADEGKGGDVGTLSGENGGGGKLWERGDILRLSIPVKKALRRKRCPLRDGKPSKKNRRECDHAKNNDREGFFEDLASCCVSRNWKSDRNIVIRQSVILSKMTYNIGHQKKEGEEDEKNSAFDRHPLPGPPR